MTCSDGFMQLSTKHLYLEGLCLINLLFVSGFRSPLLIVWDFLCCIHA